MIKITHVRSPASIDEDDCVRVQLYEPSDVDPTGTEMVPFEGWTLRHDECCDVLVTGEQVLTISRIED